MKWLPVIFATLVTFDSHASLVLYSGYITKVRCEGKLLLSAIGEQNLIALDALPQQVGCGVLLKPLVKSGRTNLALETTTGSINLIIEIAPAPARLDREKLDVKVRAQE